MSEIDREFPTTHDERLTALHGGPIALAIPHSHGRSLGPTAPRDLPCPTLLATVHGVFDIVPNARRRARVKRSMGDTLSSAPAMLSLKYPSLRVP